MTVADSGRVAGAGRPSCASGSGTNIALLANGFPDSVPFLQHIEAALNDSFEGLTFTHFDKGDASVVVSDEMLAEIEAECQAVIAAYGH